MQIAGSKELTEQVLDKDLCTVCGACVGMCPYFKVHTGKLAGMFECDLEKGRCFAHCPKTDVDFEQLAQTYFQQSYNNEPLGIYRRITAAKAGDRIGAGDFQNGGTVTALMTCAMENNLVDGAILTDRDGIFPEPKLVTRIEEVKKCASTKYMAAPSVSCLNEAAADGKTNLGFVGTACQLTGVAKMRANPLEKDDFVDPVSLSIGLFCTWALDTRQLKTLLESKLNLETITGMDVPPPPAEIFVIKTRSSTLEIPLDEVRVLVPKGCSVCPDMTAEWADVSVGAFEGGSDWNTLIIRSEKGEALVEKAVADGYLVLDEFPASSLDHLTLGADSKKKRAQEKVAKEAE
ncbi:MAG: hypothetical protein GY850_24275 [bacterium]|nr:hypothetical protein [bacterium]